MTPGLYHHPENTTTGILWMLLTMCLLTAMDTVAKYLTQDYAIPQVVWARFVFHLLALTLLLKGRVVARLRSNNLPLQFLRSVFLLMTTLMFFTGLRTVSMATTTAIMFLSPLFVTMLAIVLLKEPVGVRRWLGIITGFIGAIIIIRPDVSGETLLAVGQLAIVGAAMSNAFYQILTRKIRLFDDPMTSLLYSGLIGAILCSIVVPAYWTPPDARAWLLFMLMGFLGCISHFCLIRSFRCAPATVVTPFGYSALLWSALFGYLIFDTLPDAWTLLGAAIIIASGLYIYHREKRRSPT